MDRARDTGMPAVTRRLTLVQEIDAAKQAGFLIYMPFYARRELPDSEEERRQELAGYAYAAFRAGDFLRAVSQPLAAHHVELSVYDGADRTPANLLYGEPSNHERSGAISIVRVVPVLDRPWTMIYSTVPQPPVPPLGVFIAGLLVTGAAATLSRGLERFKRRAEKSEAATRAREGELALLVDAIPALVSYIDRDEIVRVANRRFVDWFGVAPNAITGRSVREMIGEEDYPDVAVRLRAALAGESVAFARWYNSPGGARYLNTIYVAHRVDSGAVVGVYALSSDLTAHKRSEDAARFVADCGKVLISSLDYETNCRAIVHLAVPRVADIAILFRVEGDRLRAHAVAHVSDAAQAQLSAFFEHITLPIDGANNIAVAARSGQSVVTENLDPAELDRAAANDAQRAMLRQLKLRSALHLPIIVRNKIWAVFSFGTSETSGRRLDDEYRQLAEEIATRVRLAVENTLLYEEAKNMEQELERRVEVRTAELNEAIHELEAFSYSVSHDLRAPLRTIRSFTELTLEDAAPRLTDEEKNYLDRVRRASQRLERLISDLLAYTRISKSQVELRRVDLHTLVSDIQREHPEFQPPQADVTIEGQLLPVIGNEAYLTQCISNLLGNAVKFVPPERTPHVRVWTQRQGDRVRLCVADNGIGISKEYLARAFEMFERLHLSGAYEGTGVGLAIVRRAVQRMKGTVGVESKLGEGSTFWLELPAA
jgi:PAS domain S-box-containing protein